MASNMLGEGRSLWRWVPVLPVGRHPGLSTLVICSWSIICLSDCLPRSHKIAWEHIAASKNCDLLTFLYTYSGKFRVESLQFSFGVKGIIVLIYCSLFNREIIPPLLYLFFPVEIFLGHSYKHTIDEIYLGPCL